MSSKGLPGRGDVGHGGSELVVEERVWLSGGMWW